MKPKNNSSITFRLSEENKNIFNNLAKNINVSPSKFAELMMLNVITKQQSELNTEILNSNQNEEVEQQQEEEEEEENIIKIDENVLNNFQNEIKRIRGLLNEPKNYNEEEKEVSNNNTVNIEDVRQAKQDETKKHIQEIEDKNIIIPTSNELKIVYETIFEYLKNSKKFKNVTDYFKYLLQNDLSNINFWANNIKIDKDLLKKAFEVHVAKPL